MTLRPHIPQSICQMLHGNALNTFPLHYNHPLDTFIIDLLQQQII